MSKETKSVLETVGVKQGILPKVLFKKIAELFEKLTGEETDEESDEILFNYLISGKFSIKEVAILLIFSSENRIEISKENDELREKLSKAVAPESIEPIDHSVKEDNKIAGIDIQLLGLKHISLLDKLEAQGVDLINEPSKIVESLEKNMSKRELAVSFTVTMINTVADANPLTILLRVLSQ